MRSRINKINKWLYTCENWVKNSLMISLKLYLIESSSWMKVFEWRQIGSFRFISSLLFCCIVFNSLSSLLVFFTISLSYYAIYFSPYTDNSESINKKTLTYLKDVYVKCDFDSIFSRNFKPFVINFPRE